MKIVQKERNDLLFYDPNNYRLKNFLNQKINELKNNKIKQKKNNKFFCRKKS